MKILVNSINNMVMDVVTDDEEVVMQPDIYVAGQKYEGMEYDYD